MLGSNRTLLLFSGLPDVLQAGCLRVGVAFSRIIGKYTSSLRLDLSIGKELCNITASTLKGLFEIRNPSGGSADPYIQGASMVNQIYFFDARQSTCLASLVLVRCSESENRKSEKGQANSRTGRI